MSTVHPQTAPAGVSSSNDSRPHWLLEDTTATDVFTPEKLSDEHRLMAQTTS
jgi:hypothetical protein